MHTHPDAFFLAQPEPNQSCLLALRSIIMARDERITATVKYGMPCFCYHHKMFCYLWVDKHTQEPYILMVEGQHLHHPLLEAGTRARMKILRINPNEDLPMEAIHAVLDEALSLYRNGVVAVK